MAATVPSAETTSLMTSWLDSASGATNPIVIPATEAAMFYRLRMLGDPGIDRFGSYRAIVHKYFQHRGVATKCFQP